MSSTLIPRNGIAAPAVPAVIKVMIVDDHPLLRQGLRVLIERRSRFVVCAETDNAPEAISLAVQHSPQIAIVDIALRSTNGIELTKALCARLPGIKILVISMLDEMVYADRALRAGAKGFMMKDSAPDALVAALEAITAGGTYLSADQKEKALQARTMRPRQDGRGSSGLSDREVEVLALLGDGTTTRGIAEQLNLSIKTIETYRDNLKRKLGLADSNALIHYAIQWSKTPEVG